MKRISFQLMTMVLSLALLFGCQKEFKNSPETNNVISGISPSIAQETACGTPRVLNLDEFNLSDPYTWGQVAVSNDETNVYITFTANSPFKLKAMKVVAGDFTHLQTVLATSYDAPVGPLLPDFQQSLAVGVSTFSFTIPRSWFASKCFLINVWAYIEQRTADGTLVNWGNLWAVAPQTINSHPMTSYFEYCLQDCPPRDCGQLRTQTPGGWGAPPNGQNPGTYLHNNFNAAFPTGLSVGCAPNNFWIKMTSAQAITNLLPTGGMAKALTANSTNPALIKNVLVGHLIALKLSVGFDYYDADFGEAGVHLGDMVIGSGTFKDWTVNAFLAEANKVLGGCSNSYSPKQVLETASMINENYTDGSIDNGFLVCPRSNVAR